MFSFNDFIIVPSTNPNVRRVSGKGSSSAFIGGLDRDYAFIVNVANGGSYGGFQAEGVGCLFSVTDGS